MRANNRFHTAFTGRFTPTATDASNPSPASAPESSSSAGADA
jgi:hypothetical protein